MTDAVPKREGKNRRKAAALLGVLALIMALAGCGGQKDTLRFVYEKTGMPDKECVSYEVDIGREAGGAAVTAELWEDGECTASTPLTLGGRRRRCIFRFWPRGAERKRTAFMCRWKPGRFPARF